jgi:hypothetical protein
MMALMIAVVFKPLTSPSIFDETPELLVDVVAAAPVVPLTLLVLTAPPSRHYSFGHRATVVMAVSARGGDRRLLDFPHPWFGSD